MMKEIYNPNVHTERDREFNSIYIQVNPTIVRSGMMSSKTVNKSDVVSNLAIFDIAKNELSYFLEKDNKRAILEYFYEVSYDEERKTILFNRNSRRLVNGHDLEKRKKGDKLLVFVENTFDKTFEIWTSSRLGKHKKLVKTYKERVDWELDVYNQKIFVYRKLKNEVEVEMFDWC